MSQTASAASTLSIVGPGRAGGSIASAAARAGIEVELIGRSLDPHSLSGRQVLLCVPDQAIGEVAAEIGRGDERPRLVGHTSGATRLDPLSAAAPTDGCFSMHPLQTLPDDDASIDGAYAAISASTGEADSFARELAESLKMIPFNVREADRATYHAAASIASNFLVTLEQSAADLLDEVGVEDPRRVLAPLLRRTLENWIERGPDALTGPIARGDGLTVERHRSALAESAPATLAQYDLLAERTHALGSAAEESGVSR